MNTDNELGVKGKGTMYSKNREGKEETLSLIDEGIDIPINIHAEGRVGYQFINPEHF